MLRLPGPLPPKAQKSEGGCCGAEKKSEKNSSQQNQKSQAHVCFTKMAVGEMFGLETKRKGKDQELGVQMGMLTTFPRVTQWLRGD